LYIENSGLDISITDEEFIPFLYEKYISEINEDLSEINEDLSEINEDLSEINEDLSEINEETNEDIFVKTERLRNMLEDTGDDLIYEEWDFRIDFHEIE